MLHKNFKINRSNSKFIILPQSKGCFCSCGFNPSSWSHHPPKSPYLRTMESSSTFPSLIYQPVTSFPKFISEISLGFHHHLCSHYYFNSNPHYFSLVFLKHPPNWTLCPCSLPGLFSLHSASYLPPKIVFCCAFPYLRHHMSLYCI